MNYDKEFIIQLFKSNTKLRQREDLEKFSKYLSETELCHVKTIKFSNDYIFTYCNIPQILFVDKLPAKPDEIIARPESVFKLNIYNIVKEFKKIFSRCNVKIMLEFEASGWNDKLMKNNPYKHDAYIQITDKTNKIYDIGLEYFETKHNRFNDSDKEISSKLNLSKYIVYEEKIGNHDEFIKKTIELLFLGICTIIHDPYPLCKIKFFKNHTNEKTLKKDTELFNNVMEWRRKKSFDLKIFYENAMITKPVRKNDEDNDENNEFENVYEFIEFLDEEYNIKIPLDDITNCDYNYFTKIIMRIDENCSNIIVSYRDMYVKTMDLIIESQEDLLESESESNDAKRLVPKWLSNFLLCHITYYIDRYTLEKVYFNLGNFFGFNQAKN